MHMKRQRRMSLKYWQKKKTRILCPTKISYKNKNEIKIFFWCKKAVQVNHQLSDYEKSKSSPDKRQQQVEI